VSDTRFAWREIAALTAFSFLEVILLFFGRYSHFLTPGDLKRIVWILHPEVRECLAIRAAFCHFYLLPAMKAANAIKNAAEFNRFLQWKVEQGEVLKREPQRLISPAETLPRKPLLAAPARQAIQEASGINPEKVNWNDPEMREGFEEAEGEEENSPAELTNILEEDEDEEVAQIVQVNGEITGEEDKILGRVEHASSLTLCPSPAPFSRTQVLVKRLGELISKRASFNSPTSLENIQGTNRGVEGMFSPTKNLFSRNPGTRIGVIEANVSELLLL